MSQRCAVLVSETFLLAKFLPFYFRNYYDLSLSVWRFFKIHNSLTSILFFDLIFFSSICLNLFFLRAPVEHYVSHLQSCSGWVLFYTFLSTSCFGIPLFTSPLFFFRIYFLFWKISKIHKNKETRTVNPMYPLHWLNNY